MGGDRPTSPLARAVLATLLAAIFLLLAIVLAVSLGSARIDLLGALDGSDAVSRQILIHARLPRIALAVLTGASLSLAGVAFQALLRNPLATPYTLGISSGSSFGAVLAIVGLQWLGLETFAATSVPLMAFAGAGAAVGISYLIARRRGPALPTSTLLLGGVCIAFFFGAMTLFVHYVADLGQSYLMMRWMMGSLDVGEFAALGPVLPMVLLGTGLLLAISRHLNLLAGGETVALSRGVDVRRVQQLAYFGASLITAAVVGVAGPIGFVGLVVPHSVRLLVGPDHRVLMPSALLAGAAFLVLCDLVGRTLIAPTEIPVGVITAMTGGPFLVWLLRRHARGEAW